MIVILFYIVELLMSLRKNISLFISLFVIKKCIKKTNSNIFIAYDHFRMFQVYRTTSNHNCRSVLNRSDTHCYRSCRIWYDNKWHVNTTGKHEIFKGSQQTLLKRSQKHSDLHRMANNCVLNTESASNGIVGTGTSPWVVPRLPQMTSATNLAFW